MTSIKIQHRLKRIRGQIVAVERMLNEERRCLDIVQQLSAATSALKKVTELVLTDEICSTYYLKDKNWQKKLAALLKIK